MTAQEIKQNMTQGEWRGKDTTYLKEEQFVVTPEDGGTPWVACERAIFVNDVRLGALCMYTVSSSTKYPTTVEEISADHAAIVSAVNGTYGVGIDPSKVAEIVMQLEHMNNMVETVLSAWKPLYDGDQRSLLVASYKETSHLLTAAKL